MTGDNDRHLDDDRPHNVAQCLLALGITADIRDGLFADCDSMEDEFQVIKTLYRAKILEDHPDKGGDPAVFRKTRAAFYVIRDLKNNGSVTSFLSVAGGGSNNDGSNIDDMYDEFWEQFSKGATPSYEYYEEMAQEEMPGYRVELAKSGRSKCDACKNGRSKLSATAKLADGTGRKKASGPNGKNKSTDGNSKSNSTETALVAAASEGPRRSSRTKKKPDMLAMATVDKTTDPKCIPKGNIRIGSLDDQSGSYGRWNHLVCWRVPYRIWAGLTDMTDPQQVKQDLLLLEDVLFDGVSTLPEKELNLLISHIMDEKNRVKKRKSKKAIPNLEKLRKEAEAAKAAAAAANATEKKVGTATNKRSRDEGPNDDVKISDGATVVKKEDKNEDDKKPAAKKQKADDEPDVEPDVKFPDGDDGDDDEEEEEEKDESKSSSNALAVKGPTKKQKFIIPRPGVNGAQAGVYDGKRFVLTGVFPEVGGGAGLNLGKDRVKSMIESFGGRVTGSVSGKTDFVVVGKQPGASKVRKAKDKDVPLVDLKSLNDRILGTLPALEQAEAPAIRSFSAGYQTARIANY